MKRQEYAEAIDRIVRELDELMEKDRAIIQPRSAKPVTILGEELFAYGDRFARREQLHEQLRELALQPVED